MSNSIKSQSLSAVVLPLMQVMADADLSWTDREKIAAAIQACHRQWSSMEQERQVWNSQAASDMQGLAGNSAQIGQQGY